MNNKLNLSICHKILDLLIVKLDRLSIVYLVRKVQRNIEDYGWWVAILKSAAYLLCPFYGYKVYRIYRTNLEYQSTRQEPVLNKFSFEILNSSDTDTIEKIESHAEWMMGKLRNSILKGDLCIVALFKGEVVGFNLISFGEVFIPLVKIKRSFRQGEAWSAHITTHKDFRKMGLATELRYRVFAELREQGIKKLYGGTLKSNVPALKLARRVGLKELLDIVYFRVLYWETWRYKRTTVNLDNKY